MNVLPCKHCGRREEEHHDYEPEWPAWCKCDPATWGQAPKPACNTFVGDDDQYCKTCEHDKECHP